VGSDHEVFVPSICLHIFSWGVRLLVYLCSTICTVILDVVVDYMGDVKGREDGALNCNLW